jgi:hypothetical protein
VAFNTKVVVDDTKTTAKAMLKGDDFCRWAHEIATEDTKKLKTAVIYGILAASAVGAANGIAGSAVQKLLHKYDAKLVGAGVVLANYKPVAKFGANIKSLLTGSTNMTEVERRERWEALVDSGVDLAGNAAEVGVGYKFVEGGGAADPANEFIGSLKK